MTSSAHFIDWIVLGQNHGGDLPQVNGGVKVNGERLDYVEEEGVIWAMLRCGTDPEQAKRYSVKSKQLKGSHASSVLYRSEGSTVTLSGNVGRLNRSDNVWNYDIGDTIAKASEVIRPDGLPAFTDGVMYSPDRLPERDVKAGLFHRFTGAVIRETHVTRNWYAGNTPVSCEWMRHASGQRMARVSKGSYGDETVVFGSLATRGKPLHFALVCYRKGPEMLAHAKGDLEKHRIKKSEEFQMAMDLGLIRIEAKMGSHFLRENDCRYIGALRTNPHGNPNLPYDHELGVGDYSMAKLIALYNAKTAFLLDQSPDRTIRLISELPPKIRMTALSWIDGRDVKSLLTVSTFRRHRSELMQYGIDITERRSQSSNAENELQSIIESVPNFTLRPLAMPSWYELPDVGVAA